MINSSSTLFLSSSDAILLKGGINMVINKANCTNTCQGIVMSISKDNVVEVEYQVNAKYYTIYEGLKMRVEKVKMGPFSVGQKSTPIMGNVMVGVRLMVRYNPHNPAEAYLADNKSPVNF